MTEYWRVNHFHLAQTQCRWSCLLHQKAVLVLFDAANRQSQHSHQLDLTPPQSFPKGTLRLPILTLRVLTLMPTHIPRDAEKKQDFIWWELVLSKGQLVR